MAGNQLALPSAVSLLEAQIDRKKATGQRFPNNGTVGVEDSFLSARRAPNEQVLAHAYCTYWYTHTHKEEHLSSVAQ
jgi:hypothetical protein